MCAQIVIRNKQAFVFQNGFFAFYHFTAQKKAAINKPLNNGQMNILKYSYATSVYWAKRRKEKLNKDAIGFYFSTIYPQLSLFRNN